MNRYSQSEIISCLNFEVVIKNGLACGVAGAAGAVATGEQKHGGRARWIYVLTFIVAIIAFVIVFSLNA